MCTVVEHDKSMESMIDNGEEWMEPLLELRQMLKDTQDPEKKDRYRDLKHRNGHVIFWNDRVTYGPYKFEFCKEILSCLLKAQNAVRRNGPDPEISLIHEDEIHEIQKIWRIERGDWKNTAYGLYRDITGQAIEPAKEDLAEFGGMEQEELQKACRVHGVPYELVARSLQVEFGMQYISKRQKAHDAISKILSEEWRDDMSEAVRDAENKRRQISEVYK